MSKPAVKPTVQVVDSEKVRTKATDTYDVGPVTVPFRIRRGNNEYDLVDVTFSVPSSVLVRRSRISRMEADYELKLMMMNFIGLNRFGPSGES